GPGTYLRDRGPGPDRGAPRCPCDGWSRGRSSAGSRRGWLAGLPRIGTPAATSVSRSRTPTGRGFSCWTPPLSRLRAAPAERRFRLPAAEVRCRRILPSLDDSAADGTRGREQLEQRIALPVTDGALQSREILRKPPEHFQHRFLVVEEHVAPHRRV